MDQYDIGSKVICIINVTDHWAEAKSPAIVKPAPRINEVVTINDRVVVSGQLFVSLIEYQNSEAIQNGVKLNKVFFDATLFIPLSIGGFCRFKVIANKRTSLSQYEREALIQNIPIKIIHIN